jgi:hypothetical protein
MEPRRRLTAPASSAPGEQGSQSYRSERPTPQRRGMGPYRSA